jgi:uncharacterized protein YkwD
MKATLRIALILTFVFSDFLLAGPFGLLGRRGNFVPRQQFRGQPQQQEQQVTDEPNLQDSHNSIVEEEILRVRPVVESQRRREPAKTDYIQQGRWTGERFQYLGRDRRWYNAAKVQIAENDGEFLNADGITVPYIKGDVLFEVPGLGAHKSKNTKQPEEPQVEEQKPEATPEETEQVSEVEDNDPWVPNPEKFELTPGERNIITKTNQVRARVGLGKLTVSRALMEQARAKSNNMAAQGRMDHYSVWPAPSGQRENIAYGYPDSNAAMNGWITSGGHYASIVSQTQYIGVSGVYARNGTPYWTQVFSNQNYSPYKAFQNTATKSKKSN